MGGWVLTWVSTSAGSTRPSGSGRSRWNRDAIAHGVTEALLDLVREGCRYVAGRHRGGELVNGAHGIDGQHVENRRDDAMVHAGIEIGLLGDQRGPRAPSAGVRAGHAGRDPGDLASGLAAITQLWTAPAKRDDPKGAGPVTGDRPVLHTRLALHGQCRQPHSSNVCLEQRPNQGKGRAVKRFANDNSHRVIDYDVPARRRKL